MSLDPHKQSVWSRMDLIAGLLSGLISFVVYLWSTAPNVTLLDSGEFVVAAEHFGVAHPTGYPLWTILAWLFQLLPLGNAAWEIALCSGVCAAVAVGLGGSLLSSMQRWAIGPVESSKLSIIPFFVSVSFSLMLAFSVSMWSQAVIAEVYGLHALLIAILLALLYSWIRNPSSDQLMLWAFFVLSLAFSNHHLTLVLAPLPFLLILLLKKEDFSDWLAAATITALLAYFGLAYLSQEDAVMKTAIRFLYCVIIALGLFIWMRKGRVRWKLLVLLPIVIGMGLLPYAYMPFASSTNPPMNWSYARDPEGFFFSINRSQYEGSLTDQSLRTLGKLMGTASEAKEKVARDNPLFTEESTLLKAQLWIGFFWQQIVAAFTALSLIGYFASLLFILRKPLPQRTWIYCLHVAFALAAFLQPLMYGATIDADGWWLQMPFHTYTNLIYAMLSGLGIGMLLTMLAEKRVLLFWLAPLLLILPIFTFIGSEPHSSQKDRWFGWMYGHDMLKDLPKGTIVIGGTDPGRFVPTYMIFSESMLPARFKRDPDFDRRDLYIITQNALGEPNYMKYLRDHYTTQRPPVKNAFEKWLRRDETYPAKPIILPSEEEVIEIGKKALAENADTTSSYYDDQNIIFGSILKWIWEKNRDEHEFVIEESFPVTWTYDYAIPEGLVYKLNKTKLDSIPPEAVAKDFEYWAAYCKKLLENPLYAKDYDAQRSFSKLRLSLANIYRHRDMKKEAELAYRQALALWPANAAAILGVAVYSWDRGEFQETVDFLDEAMRQDPNSIELIRLGAIVQRRSEMEKEIASLRKNSGKEGYDHNLIREMLNIYSMTGETNRADSLIEEIYTKAPDDAELQRTFASHYSLRDLPDKALRHAERYLSLEPSNGMALFMLARTQFQTGQTNAFYETARKLVEREGMKGRESLKMDEAFAPIKDSEEFKKLTTPPSDEILPLPPAPPAETSTPQAE